MGQAIRSALAQIHPFDEIVVVDDASTDDSRSAITEVAATARQVTFLQQEDNRGQLAALERGVLESSGDVLFFLDADDVYSAAYTAAALRVYHENPACDFVFCDLREFEGEPPPLDQSPAGPVPFVDVGLSMVRTIHRLISVGAATSGLSMRRAVAQKLFPLPLHEDWRTRADDCLVFGASLAGARKFHLKAQLVGYRLHGRNAYAGNPDLGEAATFFRRQVALDRLFTAYRRKFELGEAVEQLAHLEFKTIPRPSFRELIDYAALVMTHGAKSSGRIRGLGVVLKWYLQARRHGAATRRVA